VQETITTVKSVRRARPPHATQREQMSVIFIPLAIQESVIEKDLWSLSTATRIFTLTLFSIKLYTFGFIRWSSGWLLAREIFFNAVLLKH
jgi:hypothetical protein